MDLCQRNTKPGKTGTPDKAITYLFGKAVSAALPFYIAGKVFIWRSPGYHYFIRSDTA